VIDRLGVHRADHANIVRDVARVWQEVADHRAATASRLECKLAGLHRKSGLRGYHSRDPLAPAHGLWEVLVEALAQDRLVVEQIKVRRPAGLEKTDDAFRFRREMRQP
jgi:hypothetical protein